MKLNEIRDLLYPEIRVTLGDYIITQGIKIEVNSSENFYAFAKVYLTKEYVDKIKIDRNDIGIIELGYAGDFYTAFKGYVMQLNYNEITLKDEMIKLERIEITNTFLDATPREILIFLLTNANIYKYKLNDDYYPYKKTVPLTRKNGIEAIEQINNIWGIKNVFYFRNGIFYWGVEPKQDLMYVLEYGKNIISITRYNQNFEIECVGVPFIKHGDYIEVKHALLNGRVKVKEISFTTNQGFIRTIIKV